MKSQIEFNDITINQISSKFFVSLSVLYRVKKIALNIVDKGWLRKLTRLDPIHKNIVLLEMKEFCDIKDFHIQQLILNFNLKQI